MRGRVLEGALQRGVADQQPRVGLLAERDVPGLGQQHLASARPRSRSRASRRRSAPARAACARRAGSSRRRPRTRRRAAAAAAAGRRDARTRSRRSARGRARRRSSRAVQLGRHALHLVDLGVEPVEDRRHVHVRDAAEPDHAETHWKKVTRIAVAVEGGELPCAEVGGVDAVLGHGVEHVVASELPRRARRQPSTRIRQLRRARDERLGAGLNRPLDRVAVAPGFVTGLPEVDDGVVPSENGETAGVRGAARWKPSRSR